MIAGQTASTCCKKISVASGTVAALFDFLSIRDFLDPAAKFSADRPVRLAPYHAGRIRFLGYARTWLKPGECTRCYRREYQTLGERLPAPNTPIVYNFI